MSTDEQLLVKEQISISAFTVEADHFRNCDVLIKSIPGTRLRGAIDGTRQTIGPDGNPRVPIDQALSLSSFPRTPGMHLTIDPDEGLYVISDPLTENEELLKRVRQYLKETQNTGENVEGVPTKKGTIDVDAMKTLLREIHQLVSGKEMKVVRGSLPSMDTINAYRGEYLLNPGSVIPNSQPRYEKDFQPWVEKLGSVGG